jgi:phosphorylcholine phosphatase
VSEIEARLPLWPEAARERIAQAIGRYSGTDERPFAVFDADNTIWKHDLEEALLAWLERKGKIAVQDFPVSLLPLPPLPDEGASAYCQRLCAWDLSIGYLWNAQAFHGFSLAELREEIREMMADGQPIPVEGPGNSKLIFKVPKPYPAQIQLIGELQRRGVDVWAVSASLEELVRMVASDPLYGICIPPGRVIGVNLLLQRRDGSRFASAWDRTKGMEPADYRSEERMQSILTQHLYAPATWFAGKVSAIKQWIHPAQRPMLAAGDSPNDFHMQFYADAANGGIRLRVNRSGAHGKKLAEEIRRRQILAPADPAPEEGWIERTPEELGIPDPN